MHKKTDTNLVLYKKKDARKKDGGSLAELTGEQAKMRLEEVTKAYTSLFLSQRWTQYSFMVPNNFTVLGKIASGGFGRIYKVVDKIDKNLYALKQISFKADCSPQKYNKITREVYWLARFDHPHVMRYHASWVEVQASSESSDDEDSQSKSGPEKKDQKLKIPEKSVKPTKAIIIRPKSVEIPEKDDQSTSWDKDDDVTDVKANEDPSFSWDDVSVSASDLDQKFGIPHSSPLAIPVSPSTMLNSVPVLSPLSDSPFASGSGPRVREASDEDTNSHNTKKNHADHVGSPIVSSPSLSRSPLSQSMPFLRTSSKNYSEPSSAKISLSKTSTISKNFTEADPNSSDRILDKKKGLKRSDDKDDGNLMNFWNSNDVTPEYSSDSSSVSISGTQSITKKLDDLVAEDEERKKVPINSTLNYGISSELKPSSSNAIVLRRSYSSFENLHGQIYEEKNNVAMKNQLDKRKKVSENSSIADSFSSKKPGGKKNQKNGEVCLSLFIKTQLYATTLAHLLEERTCVDPAKSFTIFKQIVSGLHYIHISGCVHRDIKPSNIFISDDGCVKIGDFGLAREIRDNLGVKEEGPVMREELEDGNWISDEKHTKGLGTAIYAAPEQLQSITYTKKVDIFSLGIILFELHYIFHSKHERAKVISDLKIRRTVPPHVMKLYPHQMELVLRMTDRNPDVRPSAMELYEMFVDSTKNFFEKNDPGVSPYSKKIATNPIPGSTKDPSSGDGGVPIVSEVLTSHSASKSEDSVEISFPTNGSAISFDLSADLPPSEILLSYDKNTLVEIIKSLHAELHIERKRVAKFSSRSIDNQ